MASLCYGPAVRELEEMAPRLEEIARAQAGLLRAAQLGDRQLRIYTQIWT